MENRTQLAVYLRAEQVDASLPLQIELNGLAHEIGLIPSFHALCQTMLDRGDPKLMAPFRIVMTQTSNR